MPKRTDFEGQIEAVEAVAPEGAGRELNEAVETLRRLNVIQQELDREEPNIAAITDLLVSLFVR